MKILKLLLVGLLVMPLWAQNPEGFDSVLMGESEETLILGIRDMNRRKAAIAFNIANASTPGFKPVRFQDEIDEAARLYGDPSVIEKVNIDDEMVKSAKVRLKHSAYVRLLSTKMGITRRIASLGKGG